MSTPLTYTEEQLRLEINTLLDKRQQRRETLQPLWITQEICRQHHTGLADETTASEEQQYHIAFWKHGGYTITRKLVTRCINEREKPDRVADVPFLPGFEYLQHYYVIKRDGVDVGVPIEECTDDELLAKAALYRAQATRLIAHANEIDRYVDLRRAREAAAV
jgi:hypothetical protein